MAPKPQFLSYENDDIERIPTFEKKGAYFVHRCSSLNCSDASLLLLDLTALFRHQLDGHGYNFRISHGTDFVCEWDACTTEIG